MKEKGKYFGHLKDSDALHYLRFAALPIIAAALIAVILVSDRDERKEEPSGTGAEVLLEDETGGRDGAEKESSESGMEDMYGESSSAAPDVEETDPAEAFAGIDISHYTLKQDEDPALLAMVRTYCQAKEDCDPELLARLFGKSGLSENEIAEEAARMELVKASVKRYENISCYYIEGPETDSYVVFPYFELLYRGAEVRMPQLTWVYVTKTEDGSYVMHEEVGEAVAAYITRIGEREDVVALRTQVAEAQAAAIASDEKLKNIYSGESQVVVGN